METMSTMCGVLGGIVLAIGGYLVSFGNHKSSSIWFLFGGAVFLLLSGALYLQNKAWDSEQSNGVVPRTGDAQKIEPQTISPEIPAKLPDYIPGTKITYAKLRADLPFGYVIFFINDRTQTDEPHPSGKLEWEGDWKKTEINPDFSKGVVHWFLSNISVYYISTGAKLPILQSENVVFHITQCRSR